MISIQFSTQDETGGVKPLSLALKEAEKIAPGCTTSDLFTRYLLGPDGPGVKTLVIELNNQTEW